MAARLTKVMWISNLAGALLWPLLRSLFLFLSVSSPFSSVRETPRLRGVKPLSSGGQQGEKQRGGRGQSGFQTWLVSKCLQSVLALYPAQCYALMNSRLHIAPFFPSFLQLGFWVSLSQVSQPLCTAQSFACTSVLSAPGLGFKEKP